MDDHGLLYVFDWAGRKVRRWKPRTFYEEAIVASNPFEDSLSQSLFLGVNKGAFLNDTRKQVIELLHLSYPQGFAIDQLDSIYVADRLNHRIIRCSKGAIEGSTILDGNGKGGQVNQLDNPSSLSFDLHGNLYVADAGNHRVQWVDMIHDASFSKVNHTT
jgi:sugar lactone lactonase YvrE